MASLFISYSYVRRIDRQPVLTFKIDQPDFYINTYGVSVTENAKSSTALSDGAFYVLNKNNFPLYFNNVQPASVKFRNENGFPGTSMAISFSGTTYDTNYRYDNYLVKFKSNNVGLLTINTPIKYDSVNNTILYPFQSVEMGATYTVLNVNKINLQYYGYSKTNPNRTRSIIDITMNIGSYVNSNQTSLVTDTMVVSVNLIFTKYVPVGLSVGSSSSYIGGSSGLYLGGSTYESYSGSGTGSELLLTG